MSRRRIKVELTDAMIDGLVSAVTFYEVSHEGEQAENIPREVRTANRALAAILTARREQREVAE